MAKKVSLQGWFAQALTDKNKEGSMSQITLMHLSVLPNGFQHPKEVYSLNANSDKPWSAEFLSSTFQTQAELYAQNLDGTQYFNLICKYHKNDIDAEHPFSINPKEGSEFHSLISHPANTAGEKAQGMSLLNMICGRSFTLLEENMSFAKSIIEESRVARREIVAENAELRAENREMFTLMIEAAKKQVELDHVKRMDEMKFLRDAQERSMIIKYAPALINQFLGKEVFPQGVEDTAIIETIAQNIPEEQLQMITSMMPPLLGGPIMARLTRALKEEREAAQKAIEAGREGMKQLTEGEGGLH
jgi:hypothetical protein